MKLVLFGIVAIVIIALVYLRMRSKRNTSRRDSQASDDTRFHAVSIHYSEGACSAAKMLAGQRFLAEDAPKLPLPGCDADECRCRFNHFTDRRSKRERRLPFDGIKYGGTSRSRLKERRKGKNRRDNADEDLD